MKFIFLLFIFLCISCGPSEAEKLKLEEEIESIKAEMGLLLYHSKEITVQFVKYKTKLEEIDLAEKSLEKIRTKKKELTIGSEEYLDLEESENKMIKRILFEKEALLKMGNIDSVQIQLQSYGKKYDSLEINLKEKMLLLE